MTHMVQHRAYSAPETAFYLRLQLGPMREWSTCLADMRLGKTDIAGAVLLPIGHFVERGQPRPAYSSAAIAAFVDEVRSKSLEARKGVKLTGALVAVDEHDGRSWRERSLKFVPELAKTTAAARP